MPGARLIARQWKTLDSFQNWIDDKHFVRRTNSNSAGRVAKFPTETIRFSKPDVASCGKGLSERFQRAGLDELSGPGFNIRLPGEPGRKERIGLCQRVGVGSCQQGKNEKPRPHHCCTTLNQLPLASKSFPRTRNELKASL